MFVAPWREEKSVVCETYRRMRERAVTAVVGWNCILVDVSRFALLNRMRVGHLKEEEIKGG